MVKTLVVKNFFIKNSWSRVKCKIIASKSIIIRILFVAQNKLFFINLGLQTTEINILGVLFKKSIQDNALKLGRRCLSMSQHSFEPYNNCGNLIVERAYHVSGHILFSKVDIKAILSYRGIKFTYLIMKNDKITISEFSKSICGQACAVKMASI